VRRSRARHSHLTRAPSRHVRRARNEMAQPGPVPEWRGPTRPSFGRALRLIATAGTAAGGMCLVLAMVAWVAARGTPHPAIPSPASSDVSGHASPRDRLMIRRTLATYRGAGLVSRRHFRVSSPGNWGISWAFRCPAGQHSTFIIRGGGGEDSGDDSDGHAQVDITGPAGHGISWHTSDPGDHSLLIASRCPWTVRVVLPRPPAGGQGARSPPDRTIGNGHHPASHGPRPGHPKNASTPRKLSTPRRRAEVNRTGDRRGAVSRRSAGSSGSA